MASILYLSLEARRPDKQRACMTPYTDNSMSLAEHSGEDDSPTPGMKPRVLCKLQLPCQRGGQQLKLLFGVEVREGRLHEISLLPSGMRYLECFRLDVLCPVEYDVQVQRPRTPSAALEVSPSCCLRIPALPQGI